MKTNAEKQEFIMLWAQGLSLQKISEQINISKKTLVNWDKEFLEEIDNLKAMELESLRESYRLTKHAELARVGRLLERVTDELDTHSLTDVKSERLIELAVKLGGHFSDRTPDPVMRDDTAVREHKEARALVTSLGTSEGALDTTGSRSLRNGNGTMDAQSLMKLRVDALRRYEAGEINEHTAVREMALITPLIREADAARLQAQLERIEAILSRTVLRRPKRVIVRKGASARDRGRTTLEKGLTQSIGEGKRPSYCQ